MMRKEMMQYLWGAAVKTALINDSSQLVVSRSAGT